MAASCNFATCFNPNRRLDCTRPRFVFRCRHRAIPWLGKYNFLISGLALTLTYWALVFYYQRSFDYAITSNAVIFKHAFLLSRSHRRILFDRISEVQVERTPFGTMTGFATLTILTDSGVGIVEESVGGSVGIRQTYPKRKTTQMQRKQARAF